MKIHITEEEWKFLKRVVSRAILFSQRMPQQMTTLPSAYTDQALMKKFDEKLGNEYNDDGSCPSPSEIEKKG